MTVEALGRPRPSAVHSDSIRFTVAMLLLFLVALVAGVFCGAVPISVEALAIF